MKAKFLLAALVAMALSLPSMAQKSFSIGPRLGFNLSMLGYKNPSASSGLTQIDGVKSLATANFGVQSVIRPNEGQIAAYVALTYWGTGYTMEEKDSSDQWMRSYYHNIAVDLAGRFYFLPGEVSPYVTVGLRPGYRVGITNWASKKYETQIDEQGVAKDTYDNTNPFMLNAILGVGFQVSKFTVDLEYSPSITQMGKALDLNSAKFVLPAGIEDYKPRLNVISLNLGLLF